MIYRFNLISDEVDDFKLEIQIDSDDTFLSLRNVILDAAGYTKDQMDSFIICDEEWNKEKEVTLTDMGADSDEDIWLMDETKISELIDDEGDRLTTDRNSKGDRLPATYANFLILNGAVIYPTYNQPEKDEEAKRQIQLAFPDRDVIGVDSLTIIRQHGSIHCLTMQLPEGAIK